MLVLSRKENERLIFPSLGISIEVSQIRGNKVRLGIDAPADVPVLREELADLKGLEFTPDDLSSENRLKMITEVHRAGLASVTHSLNSLHRHLDSDADGQAFVLDIFRQLQGVQKAVADSLSDDRSEPVPHALLIQRASSERDLLASCLRFGGIEVITSASREDAEGYLSLHSCPDFAIIDSVEASTDFIDVLRTRPYDQMQLFGLGEIPALAHCFPRPLNAETLVEKLTRDFAGRMAL